MCRVFREFFYNDIRQPFKNFSHIFAFFGAYFHVRKSDTFREFERALVCNLALFGGHVTFCADNNRWDFRVCGVFLQIMKPVERELKSFQKFCYHAFLFTLEECAKKSVDKQNNTVRYWDQRKHSRKKRTVITCIACINSIRKPFFARLFEEQEGSLLATAVVMQVLKTFFGKVAFFPETVWGLRYCSETYNTC